MASDNVVVCNICDETPECEEKSIVIGCRHSFCSTCFVFCMATVIEGFSDVMNTVRFACPGVTGGKRCNFSLDNEKVHSLLFSHRTIDSKIKKAFYKLDNILVFAFVREHRPDLRLCPKCRSSYASTCDSEVKGEVTCSCGFQFCPNCDGATSVHKDKTCAQLSTEISATLDKATPTCPACSALTEKNGGCNHIICKCGYEWCYQCRGPYFDGHLEMHAANRITVNVPGEQRPLQITQTPHTVYRLSQNDTSSTVKPSTLAGDDIPRLFQEHNVVKLVRIATKDPVSGAVTYKEGILLKRKRQSDSNTPVSGDNLEDESAKKRLLQHFAMQDRNSKSEVLQHETFFPGFQPAAI